MRFGVCVNPGVSLLFLRALADVGIAPALVLTRDPTREPAERPWRQRTRARALAMARPALRTPLGDAVERVSNTWLFAERQGWPVHDDALLRRDDLDAALLPLTETPLDAWLVFGFRILPPPVLAWTTHGALGFHPSLLPAHRGASPMYWTVRAGERASGYSIFALDAAVDAGPTLLRGQVPLAAEDDASTALDHVCALGARAFARLVLAWSQTGQLPEPLPSLGEAGAVEPRAARDPVRVVSGLPAEELRRRVRAGRHLGGAPFEAPALRVVEALSIAGLAEQERRPLAGGRTLVGIATSDEGVLGVVVRPDD